jgi:hypothetical protein
MDVLKNVIKERMQNEFPKSLKVPKAVFAIAEYMNLNSPKLSAGSNDIIQSERSPAYDEIRDWWYANSRPGSFFPILIITPLKEWKSILSDGSVPSPASRCAVRTKPTKAESSFTVV